MTDLRERLADALTDERGAFWGFPPLRRKAMARRVADVLVSLPDIAVVDGAEWDQLLAVAALYVEAFSADELMTLPERLRLQQIEDIVTAHAAKEEQP